MTTHRGAGASAVPRGPLHLRAAEQIIRYDVLPGGDVEGTRRGVANGIAATSTMVNVLEMPPGQSSPQRQFTGDHVIFQLAGTAEWNVEGVLYQVEPGDILFFPPDTTYSFANRRRGRVPLHRLCRARRRMAAADEVRGRHRDLIGNPRRSLQLTSGRGGSACRWRAARTTRRRAFRRDRARSRRGGGCADWVARGALQHLPHHEHAAPARPRTR